MFPGTAHMYCTLSDYSTWFTMTLNPYDAEVITNGFPVVDYLGPHYWMHKQVRDYGDLESLSSTPHLLSD